MYKPCKQRNPNEIHYPESNKNSLAETQIHFKQIFHLIETLKHHFYSQSDVYVTGIIKFQYKRENVRRTFSPDVAVVKGVGNYPRSTYKLWEEKQSPQVVFEISSRKNWDDDLNKKWFLYQQFGVKEYYIFDPEYDYLPEPLIAYRLKRGELVKVSVKNSRIFSEEIGLEIVDTGAGLRLFDPETKQFMRTLSEENQTRRQAEEEVARLREELEKLKSRK